MRELDKDLPTTSHEFLLDIQGRLTKRRYLGEFVCKIPTIKDQALIAKHKAMLNGEFPVYLDPGIVKIHDMIAYLRYTLTDYPKFWRESDLGYDLRDDNLIQAVYDEVIDFENNWLKKIWEEEPQKETDEPKEDEEKKRSPKED